MLEAVSAFLMAICGIKASRKFYLVILNSLLHQPISFHESNPSGRVLNRLSDDMAEIDYVIPFTVRSMINVILQALASFGIIMATLHLFAIVVPPLGIIYFFVQVNKLTFIVDRCSHS